MAENKGIMLAKSVQKHAGRAKEKLLISLGKVQRTEDDIFNDHLNNFNRQQQQANRLQKEFNNYLRCIKATQAASKNLMDAICEIYEPQWSGFEGLQAQVSATESLWQDYSHKLGDLVLIPLSTYAGQFPEMKKKVEKRNRKLIDYDGQRHSYKNLQENANKRKDDVKLAKARDQLEDARRTYELLNTELHDELPALFESRILFLVTNLQTLFATEQVFHNETSKIFAECEAIIDKLATETQRGSNTLRKQTSNAIKASSPVQSMPVKQLNNANITNNSNSNQYQNQITSNGTGNNNPPSPSTSLEPRLDSTSPTPSDTRPSEVPTNTGVFNEIASSSGSSYNKEQVITTTTSTIKENLINKDNVDDDADDDEIENCKKQVQSLNSSHSSPMYVADTTTDTTITTTATAIEMAAKTSPVIDKNKDLHKFQNINDLDDVDATVIDMITTTTKTTVDGNELEHQQHEQQQQQHMNGNANDVAVITPRHLNKDNNINTANNNHNNSTTTTSTNTISITAIPTTITTSSTVTTTTSTIASNSNGGNVVMPMELDAIDLPPGVLYRVKATYGYVKEDADELSFEVGDIIRVIEYDDPEDQEEGWLMGQKEGTDEKGLFPANFTRPI